MRTVGEILGQRRKELNLTLEQVEKEIKIRQKYLEAIEKNNFSQIPESTIVKGFIRNYALYLSLPPDNILAVFRRDFFENEKGQIIPRGMVQPLDKKSFGFYWTPKLTTITAIALLFGGFIFFFFRQYLNYSSPPFLEVFSPKEGQAFNGEVLIFGKTDKDASIKVDGSVIPIDNTGVFREEIVLPRGENTVVIETSNRQQKKRSLNIKVNVE